MAKHLHGKKNSQDATAASWRTGWDSEYIHAEHLLNANGLGLIKLSKNQTLNAKTFLKTRGYANKRKTVIANGSITTSKMVGVISSGLPGSPIHEMQDAARQSRKIQRIAAVMRMLCAREGVAIPVTYMITYTVPNQDLGTLKAVLVSFNTAQCKLRDSLTKPKGYLHNNLPAEDGGTARFMGDSINTEITINEACMGLKCPAGLFHAHNHQVATFDKPLDETLVTFTQADVPNMIETTATMGAGAFELFKFWANLNCGVKLSAKAFSCERAYVEDEDGDRHDDVTAALAEANKYPIKPTIYKRLPAKPSLFSTKVMAELINATAKRKMRRNHGLMLTAAGYVNWAESSKLGPAIMVACFKGEKSSRTYVPDLFTARWEHSVKANRGVLDHREDLTDEQLLWFNRPVLAGAGFDAGLLEGIDWPDDERGETYKWLTEQLIFADRGKAGALAHADSWTAALEADRADAVDKGQKTGYIDAKLADVSRVRDAMANLLDDNGGYTFKVNWTRRAKVLAALDTMNEYDKKAEKWTAISADREAKTWRAVGSMAKPSQQELALMDLFGRGLFGAAPDARFLPESWFKAFALYKKLGRDLAAKMLWTCTSDDLQAARGCVTGTALELVQLYILTGCEDGTNAIDRNEADDIFDTETSADSYTDSAVTTHEQVQAIVDKLRR